MAKTKYGRDSIGYLLFKNPTLETVESFGGFSSLIAKNDHSITSNILRIAISIPDLETINLIVDNCSLMKRDFLELTRFFYHSNHSLALKYFQLILEKNILLSKDVDFLVSEKLIDCLSLLDGFFIHTSILESSSFDYSILRTYPIPEYIRINILSEITPKLIDVSKIISILNSLKYDVIIDAGNVLHLGHPKPNPSNLQRLIKTIEKDYKNPLIVIHKRHLKLPGISELCAKYPHLKTPYGLNDDWYILLAFLLKPSVYIVSLDKFRDHIFEYRPDNPNQQQFKHILAEHTLTYTLSSISKPPKFSHCIQLIDEKIYIPINDSKSFLTI